MRKGLPLSSLKEESKGEKKRKLKEAEEIITNFVKFEWYMKGNSINLIDQYISLLRYILI